MHLGQMGWDGGTAKQRQSTLRVSSESRVCGAPLRDDEFRPVLFEVPTESCREMKLSTRGGKCESDSGERWSGEKMGVTYIGDNNRSHCTRLKEAKVKYEEDRTPTKCLYPGVK